MKVRKKEMKVRKKEIKVPMIFFYSSLDNRRSPLRDFEIPQMSTESSEI